MNYIRTHILFIILTALCTIGIIYPYTAKADQAGLYVRKSIGFLNVHNNDTSYGDYKGTAKVKRSVPIIGIGGGYDFGNGYRVESVFNYYLMFSHKETGKLKNLELDIQLDTRATSFVINAYKDYVLTNKIKMHIGAGAGIASIKDESKGFAKSASENHSMNVLPPAYGKQVYRLTYNLITGLSYKFNKDLVGDLSYNYLYLGKNSPQYVNGQPNLAQRTLKAHSITLGLRLYI